MSAPLRFLPAQTISEHLPPGPIRQQAEETRALVDRTEAAAQQVFTLDRPEQDRQASGEDAAATSAALQAPEWTDPGTPAADALAAARKSARAELAARQAVSDRAVIRFGKAVAREVGELTKADREQLAKAAPKIATSLEKLRPMLAEADVRARRIAWLEWVSTHRLDSTPPRRLSPESMPPGDTLLGLLDRLLTLAQGER